MGKAAQTKKKERFKKLFPEGRKAFAKAKKKAGISGVTKHDVMRKTLEFNTNENA